jgi:hypothetical protein
MDLFIVEWNSLKKEEYKMNEKLLRIGTTYIPVSNVELSSDWYVNKLGGVRFELVYFWLFYCLNKYIVKSRLCPNRKE